MKSWADYNSSDDEDDFFSPENNPPVPGVQEPEKPQSTLEEEVAESATPAEEEPLAEPLQRRKKDYVLPERPPYTAFIGNLAFSMKDPNELGQKIKDLTKDRFDKEINVTATRVAIDRRDGKHKGFGYVEVENLEQLQAVLELDDGQSIISGRAIHLDVAQPASYQRSGSMASRSSSFSEIDGSRFQGGRFSKQRSGSFRRQNSAPVEQRPSLKLQPRSKDREGSGGNASSNSSIFGGGKARDGDTWEKRRMSTREEEKPQGGAGGGGNLDRRSSRSGGRGGRGNNRGGRGVPKQTRQSSTSSRAGPGNGEENSTKNDAGKKEDQRKSLQPVEPEKPAAPSTKKVSNKFAALDFGDSDDE